MSFCIACTGANGKVGKLLTEKYGVVPIKADVTNVTILAKEIEKITPDLVIHLACKSNVDWVEKNYQEAVDINFGGTKNVAKITNSMKIGMVLLSSDHIFDGKKGNYKENYKFLSGFPYWKYNKPVNCYGLTKLAAEGIRFTYKNMKIVRTSRLFSTIHWKSTIESNYQPIFIKRSFMYLPHFVANLKLYVDRFYQMPEILNLSGSEIVSYYEFEKNCLENKKVFPRKKDIGGTPRPYKGGLDISLSTRLGFPQYSYLDGIKELKNV